jgi:hypothetical protein
MTELWHLEAEPVLVTSRRDVLWSPLVAVDRVRGVGRDPCQRWRGLPRDHARNTSRLSFRGLSFRGQTCRFRR